MLTYCVTCHNFEPQEVKGHRCLECGGPVKRRRPHCGEPKAYGKPHAHLSDCDQKPDVQERRRAKLAAADQEEGILLRIPDYLRIKCPVYPHEENNWREDAPCLFEGVWPETRSWTF